MLSCFCSHQVAAPTLNYTTDKRPNTDRNASIPYQGCPRPFRAEQRIRAKPTHVSYDGQSWMLVAGAMTSCGQERARHIRVSQDTPAILVGRSTVVPGTRETQISGTAQLRSACGLGVGRKLNAGPT